MSNLGLKILNRHIVLATKCNFKFKRPTAAKLSTISNRSLLFDLSLDKNKSKVSWWKSCENESFSRRLEHLCAKNLQVRFVHTEKSDKKTPDLELGKVRIQPFKDKLFTI